MQQDIELLIVFVRLGYSTMVDRPPDFILMASLKDMLTFPHVRA